MKIQTARYPAAAPQTVFRNARTSELSLLQRLAPPEAPLHPALVANGRIRVLAEGGSPLGAVGWLEVGAARVVLRTLFVTEGARGQGHGIDLFDGLLAEVRHAGHRWIDADAPTAAVPFLVKCGFRAFGPAPYFVDGNPVTGVWMTRSVAPRAAYPYTC